MYNYLQDNKLLSPTQFGVRPKSSTEFSLVNFTDSILENMDRGLFTGVVSIDLTKAFDTVNDLPSCIQHCNVPLYADDRVIYFSSSDVSVVEDKLNSDLKSLSRWLNENLLKLNETKCKLVIFGSNQKLAK